MSTKASNVNVLFCHVFGPHGLKDTQKADRHMQILIFLVLIGLNTAATPCAQSGKSKHIDHKKAFQ